MLVFCNKLIAWTFCFQRNSAVAVTRLQGFFEAKRPWLLQKTSKFSHAEVSEKIGWILRMGYDINRNLKIASVERTKYFKQIGEEIFRIINDARRIRSGGALLVLLSTGLEQKLHTNHFQDWTGLAQHLMSLMLW